MERMDRVYVIMAVQQLLSKTRPIDAKFTADEVRILTTSATGLAKCISEGVLSSREVVGTFISRIETVNPALNAVVAKRYEEAVEEAIAIDTLVQGGQTSAEELLKEKPLLGVPITVKECISVRGMPYTAGLVKRAGTVAEEDAPIVKNLRDAGAIPIGVTNCSEVCSWFETYNNVYGMTHNPYNLACSSGGSTGGEGAIISAAGSVLGLGTDGGGSVRMPAFLNGLFSHKPSANVLNCEKTWPLPEGPAAYMSSAGCLCRYAEDLATTIDLMAGISPLDESSFTQRSRRVDVRSMKVISIPDDSGSKASSVHPEVREAQTRVGQHLSSQLQVSVETMTLPALGKVLNWWSDIADETTSPKLSEILANCEGSISPFWEMGKWVFGRSEFIFPSLLQSVLERFSGDPKLGEDNAEAHRKRDELKHELENLMGDNGVILYPAMPQPAYKHHRTILHPFDFIYSCLANLLSMPSTTVPLGTSQEGLPLGIQILAKEGNDHLTLAVAMEISQSLAECHWTCPPMFPIELLRLIQSSKAH